jgi:CRP-like cAMP-binding protein
MEISARDADLLRQGPWFGHLPARLQDLIFDRSVERSYGKGEAILREGEPGKGMGAVLDGRVHLLRRAGDANEVLLDVGDTGFWFGHYGTLSGGAPSIGSIVAITPVRTLFLPVAAFERIVGAEPRFYRMFADILLDRHAHMFRYLAEAQGLPPEERLRTRLLDLAHVRRASESRHRSGAVSIPVSQAELATMVGVSRQTLSALLARLESRGLIEVGFRTVRVLA